MRLDEWFTCSIKVNHDTLTVQINGETVETCRPDVLDDWPAENTYYFKAGSYLQHDTPDAAATVVFSSLTVAHPVGPTR